MEQFVPKLFDVMKTYSKQQLIKDIISGIIVAKDDAVATSITGVVGYTKNLVDYIVSENNKSV